MNIVFIGASHFGQRCLECLLHIEGIKVSGIVTAPPKFTISYSEDKVTNVLHSDLTKIAHKNSINIVEISNGMKDKSLFDTVASWEPDIFIVSGWYHMIPKRWREYAPTYGLHASLLPKYSGGAPLVWAMINGEKETGITLFQFDGGVDSGPIIGQASTTIEHDDTIATLYSRIEELGLELIRQHIPIIKDKEHILIEQDNTLRTTLPQRSPKDGLINWNQSAEKIHNFIRAQTKPYPGAFSLLKNQQVHIWSSKIAEPKFIIAPGEIKLFEANIYVGCFSNDAIQILDATIRNKQLSYSDLKDIKGFDSDNQPYQ
jgi:methionyl-tRNA formyltransferase